MCNYVKEYRSQKTWHGIQVGLYVSAGSNERHNKSQKKINGEAWGWEPRLTKVINALQIDLILKIYFYWF